MPPSGGFLVALQDKKGFGRADVVERFGQTIASGGKVALALECIRERSTPRSTSGSVRYSLPANSIIPSAPADTIVSGLPLDGDHPMHPFIIANDGTMYVDVASATNS